MAHRDSLSGPHDNQALPKHPFHQCYFCWESGRARRRPQRARKAKGEGAKRSGHHLFNSITSCLMLTAGTDIRYHKCYLATIWNNGHPYHSYFTWIVTKLFKDKLYLKTFHPEEGNLWIQSNKYKNLSWKTLHIFGKVYVVTKVGF